MDGIRPRRIAGRLASLPQLTAQLDADLMGRSCSEKARRLIGMGIATVTGRKFYPQTVKNYLTRTGGFANEEILDL
jgi:hypothetical protein